ncbi:MAG TPA: hypothetical protein PK523_05510, partial [Elusimicrobiales bacterium]|nr:hypothetical protein [Elusimicrobiales bacterium]
MPGSKYFLYAIFAAAAVHLLLSGAGLAASGAAALWYWVAVFVFLALRALLARSPLAGSRASMNLLAGFSMVALIASPFVLLT